MKVNGASFVLLRRRHDASALIDSFTPPPCCRSYFYNGAVQQTVYVTVPSTNVLTPFSAMGYGNCSSRSHFLVNSNNIWFIDKYLFISLTHLCLITVWYGMVW